MAEVKITEFLGINNVGSQEDVRLQDFQHALNVDVTNAKKFRRRPGDELLLACDPHSLFSDGVYRYYREGTALKRLNSDNSSDTLRNDLVSGNHLTTFTVNGLTYYSDGVYTGVIDNGASRSWGLEVPATPVAVNAAGELPTGLYQVQLTYVRNDGQESGSSVTTRVNVVDGGVSITNIPTSSDSTVTHVNVYLSAADGETLWRILSLENGTATASYRGDGSNRSVPLRTQNLKPPRPCNLIQFFNGRLFMAEGGAVWHTEKYNFELVDLSKNFMPFEGTATMVAPVTNGVWIGSDRKTVYISMEDPMDGMKVIDKADYGVISGTAAPIDGDAVLNGNVVTGGAWIWATSEGFCVGGNEGIFINLTSGRYEMPFGHQGMGIVRKRGDIDQYVVSFYVNGNNVKITLPALEASARFVDKVFLPALEAKATFDPPIGP